MNRALILALTAMLWLFTSPQTAQAQGSVGFGGSVDSQKGASGRSSGSGGKLPFRVIGGNAVSALLPVQVGFVSYLPRVRIGFQYDRQLYKHHWVHGGVAVLLDRGNWETFRLPSCGFGDNPSPPNCEAATVAGFDLWFGYTYKFYVRNHPYLVPHVRGSVGGGFWKYPKIGSSRIQQRDWSWTMNLRPGGGLRLFLLDNLGIGIDLNLILGFVRSKDQELNQVAVKSGKFLLGMEILPLIVEYRF